MMLIRKKTDIKEILNNFEKHAEWDETGRKHYFFFHDQKRGGDITIMKYPEGSWTIHSKGETYCDENETLMEMQELVSLVWEHRKFVNKALEKEKMQV